MKWMIRFFLCLSLVPLTLRAELSEARKDLKRHGGIARFELTVKDDRGVPVEDAEGKAEFWQPRGQMNEVTRTTNDEGHVVLSGHARYQGWYTITKDKYYTTTKKVSFEAPEEKAGLLERRRWVPVVEEVTLKRKVNPIPMYAWRVRLPVPALDQPLPLDLEKMEWCAPYGEGVHEDMWVTLASKIRTVGQRSWTEVAQVTFAFKGEFNGIQFCDVDEWSELKSAYHADPQSSFLSELSLEQPIDPHRTLPSDKYLVYRVRSKVSPEGELLSANYGKIYASSRITREEFSLLAVYFNPTTNDTNLEFDPKQNLAPEKKIDYRKRKRALAP